MRTPGDLAICTQVRWGQFMDHHRTIDLLHSRDLQIPFQEKWNISASGSAHPGGGMPMAMISGKHAAKAFRHQFLTTL